MRPAIRPRVQQPRRTHIGLGRLTAYRTSNGESIWSVDVVGELGGRVPPWGYAESVLIDGDKLIWTPGGEQTGTFAALDKKTGRVLWRSTDVTERAEYASPILVEYNNVRQVVTMTRGGLVAVFPENGKLIWRYNRFASMGTRRQPRRTAIRPAMPMGMCSRQPATIREAVAPWYSNPRRPDWK